MNFNNNNISIVEMINEQREKFGFLSIKEVFALTETGNMILNPYTFLISRNVKIGENNRFFTNIIINNNNMNNIKIGSNNIFYSNLHLVTYTGDICIGSNNQFSNGLLAIVTNVEKAKVLIADNGRYDGNIKIYGQSSFGNGCQILGDVEVINCHLEGGDSYLSDKVEQRAALLKGQGRAVGMKLGQGQVIRSQNGEFAFQNMMPQTFFHPK